MKILTEIEDTIYDFIYRLKKPYDTADRCYECPMCYTEQTSYEYDEYESTCMYGRDMHELEHCFVPFTFLKFIAPRYRNKFEYEQEHQWDGLVDYMEERGLLK